MRALRYLGYGLGALVGLFVVLFAALQTGPGQRLGARLVTQLASGPQGGLEIRDLGGFFPTDLRIGRVASADRQGAWLVAEDVELRWSLLPLLQGRLRIEALRAGRLSVLRAPTAEASAPDASAGGGGLPLGIDLRRLDIADLHLGKDLVGAESHWRLSGNATVTADLGAGAVTLAGQRIDGPAGALSVDLRFDGRRQWIDGTVTASEGPGGLAAVLLERQELGGFSLQLVAKGDAQNGTAQLQAAADNAVTVRGTLDWQPRDGATAAGLRVDAAAPGLPPGPLAEALRQPLRLEADAVLRDPVVELSRLVLTSGPQRLEATGRYDRRADRAVGSLIAQSSEPAGLASLAGGIAWRGLRLEAKADVAGLTTAPRGSAELSGHLEALSLAGLEPRLPSPGAIDLKAAATLGDGRIAVTGLDVTSALLVLSGTGAYQSASAAGEAKARLVVPELAPFSSVIGRTIAGATMLDVTATTNREGQRLVWQGNLTGMRVEGVGGAALDAPFVLAGAATARAGGAWTLSDARLSSANGRLTVSGQGAGTTGTLDLALDLPRLSVIDDATGGAARASARLTLEKDRTEARVDGAVTGLKRGLLASQSLTVSASGVLAAGGGASGSVKVEGDLAEQPVSLDGKFSLSPAGEIEVPTFQGRWASALLDVENFAIAGDRASGHARLRVARLEDASALGGTALAGSLDAALSADPASAGQALDIRVEGKGLRAGSIGLATLNLKATVERPGPDLSLDGTLDLDGLVGVADLSSAKITAKGSLQDMAVALQAGGRETRATVEATVRRTAQELAVVLRRLDGSYRSIPVALTAPSRIAVVGERTTIEPLSMRVGTGRVSARGFLAAEGNDLQVEIAALPLQLIDAFAPGSGLDGSLQAKAQVRGTSAAPAVEATYTIAALRLRRPEAALLPSIALQGTAALAGSEASLQTRATAGGGTALTLKGRATLPRAGSPLDASATLSGNLDLAPFAPLLGNDVRNVSGRLRPDLSVAIRGAEIIGSGAIDFSNGALSLPESGIRLSGGQGRLLLQGSLLQIQRLAFQTAGNGTVTVAGSVGIDPQGSVRPDLSVTSQSALLVNRPDLIARVSANLRVTGDTASAIDVAGPIRIERAEVSIGGQQTADFPTIEVREVDKPGATPAQLLAAPLAPKPLPGNAAAAAGVPVRLNLTIDAPQAVFVRGRGLDAEMGGQLSVGGTPAAPAVTGGLALRRGEFNLLGRRLTFSKGIVTLDNLDRIDPRLDFVANTTVQSTTITVTIQGTARAPSVAVTSSPSLPPDEAMALLLFGKPASGLSVFELAQAAQGVAELTGQGSGSSVLGKLRGGLGLDRLSVNSGNSATAPVSVEAGRYVAPGIYVGARQGATGNSSRGVVQVEVLDHVKIEGDIGADSNGRIGVKTEWDY